MELKKATTKKFGTLQSLTGPVQGFAFVVFPHRENPVFISWDPCNENRFFPVGNTTQGKPCSLYRDEFAVKVVHKRRN